MYQKVRCQTFSVFSFFSLSERAVASSGDFAWKRQSLANAKNASTLSGLWRSNRASESEPFIIPDSNAYWSF